MIGTYLELIDLQPNRSAYNTYTFQPAKACSNSGKCYFTNFEQVFVNLFCQVQLG